MVALGFYGFCYGVHDSKSSRVISSPENFVFTGIHFTLDARDNPVAGADAVPLFERVYPAVDMMRLSALFAGLAARYVGVAVQANNLAFCGVHAGAVYGEVLNRILWMIAVLEPLRSVNDDWFFAVFHGSLSGLRKKGGAADSAR